MCNVVMIIEKKKTILTIDPANSYTFKESHPQKSTAARRVKIKQLEHVHSTLKPIECRLDAELSLVTSLFNT